MYLLHRDSRCFLNNRREISGRVSMIWLILAIAANITANLFLKAGATIAASRLDATMLDKLFGLAVSPKIWIGTGFAALLLVAYLMALRNVPVSLAYPLTTGLAMLGIMLGGSVFFGETITITKVAGTILIVIGAVLLTR